MALVCRLGEGRQIALAAVMFVAVELYLSVRLGCVNCRALYQRISGSFQAQQAGELAMQASGAKLAELATLWEEMKPFFEQMQLDRAILTLEKVNEKGRRKYETYQWVRSEALLTELLRSRWTKRFSLGGDDPRIATLRLESAEQFSRDEQRIDWLLKQISDNMRFTGLRKPQLQPQPEEELVQTGT
jgi:hypothetical protein